MKKELREEIKSSVEKAAGSENPAKRYPKNALIRTAFLAGLGVTSYFIVRTLSDHDKRQKAVNYFKKFGQRDSIKQAKEKFQEFTSKQPV